MTFPESDRRRGGVALLVGSLPLFALLSVVAGVFALWTYLSVFTASSQ